MNIFLVCLSIFMARIVDVSIGVVRTIVMVKGSTKRAAILAFFEVLVWYMAAREALNIHTTNGWIAISYAAGYATGTYIGSILSKCLVKGTMNVQVITEKGTKKNLDLLRRHGYAVSVLDMVDDYDGRSKKMFMIEVKNQKLKELTKIIRKFDNKAFITASETKLVENGFIK